MTTNFTTQFIGVNYYSPPNTKTEYDGQIGFGPYTEMKD